MEPNKLKCLAVDDEPYALKLLTDDIASVPFLELSGTCSSAREADQFLRSHHVDLMFLDIQMPEMTGMQFLRELNHAPLTIITTAYPQFALEGFELEVVDYLMKPIPRERFLQSVHRARERWQHRDNKVPEFIFVHSEYREIRLPLEDIIYIEGMKDYVKIFLKTQTRPLMTRMNLKAMEGRLPATSFCRIHNSYIVPMARITAFQKSQVFLGELTLPVGERFAAQFISRYSGN